MTTVWGSSLAGGKDFFVCGIWTSLQQLIGGKSFHFLMLITLTMMKASDYFIESSFWIQCEERVNNMYYKTPQYKVEGPPWKVLHHFKSQTACLGSFRQQFLERLPNFLTLSVWPQKCECHCFLYFFRKSLVMKLVQAMTTSLARSNAKC